jgi:hypothetical protein
MLALCASPTWAQQAPGKPKKSAHEPRITAKPILPNNGFRPTCNLDSGAVGFYFFPANLGATWTMRTISETLDESNKVLKSDTTFSFERVVSDSNRTLQGLPVLRCESSTRFHEGHEKQAVLKEVEYYVDDSVVIAVVNHSIASNLNHTLIVNPLRVGTSWRDNPEDTLRTTIIALDEPVTTDLGSFPKSIVVKSTIRFGELSKYFVPGVGIVKYIFRGISPSQNGAFVVTTELVNLDKGDPKRSIKFRFAPAHEIFKAGQGIGHAPIPRRGKGPNMMSRMGISDVKLPSTEPSSKGIRIDSVIIKH